MEDSRPIFFCKRFSYNENALYIQPFSQKSRTPTVAKEFQIGLCGVVEADLELFCNCWSAGFFGERLYLLQYPLPVLVNFCGRQCSRVTAVFPTCIWSNKKRSTRQVSGELDQNITSSERTVPVALKGPGNGKVDR